MARPRREKLHQEIAEDIKSAAREQMRQHGTAGLSLRGIARKLGITAPAIYNYFPNLEDLITALIVDAFSSLGEAMESAPGGEEAGDTSTHIRARVHAYREWALDNPIQFQLIYGNPIPGYEAPLEVTGPLARRPFEGIFRLFVQAWEQDELQIPQEYLEIPASVAGHLDEWKAQYEFEAPAVLFYLLAVGWSRIHGMVMLELFHHSQPMVGDPGAFYRHEVDVLLGSLGKD